MSNSPTPPPAAPAQFVIEEHSGQLAPDPVAAPAVPSPPPAALPVEAPAAAAPATSTETASPQDSGGQAPAPTPPPVEEASAEVQTRTAPSSPGDERYRIGEWNGFANYACPHCIFTTIDGPGTVDLHIADARARVIKQMAEGYPGAENDSHLQEAQ